MDKKPVWAHNNLTDESRLNIDYCSGRDVRSIPMADYQLIPFDLWTNQAHCLMLYKCSILDKKEAQAILSGLQKLADKYEKEEFTILPQLEDIHTNVEYYLEQVTGAQFSGKIHTARSRNDQVTCDLRLYIRSKGTTLAEEALHLVQEILNKAANHVHDVMPGITHFQPAVTTSFAHLLSSYAQALLRDIHRLIQFLQRSNINPLGAAAAYGTSWPIDRRLTAKYLGFDDLQQNSLDCITNRWEFETEFTSIISFFMHHLSIISQDLILFSSPYLKFCTILPAYTTGSSIMPQKQNPDFAEVTRAKAAIVSGHLQALLGIAKGMNSGYNRDTQWVKYLIQDVLRETAPAFHLFSKVFHSLQTHPENMLQKCREGFVNAVDIADFLSQKKGLSFRKAYSVVGKSVNQDRNTGALTLQTLQNVLKEEKIDISLTPEEFELLTDYRTLLERKISAGAPAPQETVNSLEKLHEQHINLQSQLSCFEKNVSEAYQKLQAEIQNLISDIQSG